MKRQKGDTYRPIVTVKKLKGEVPTVIEVSKRRYVFEPNNRGGNQMRTIDAHEDYMKSHIVDQLNDLGYRDTDGLELRELINKLARARALEVDVSNSGSKWF